MSKRTLDSLLAKTTLEQISHEFLRGRSQFVRKCRWHLYYNGRRV
jgi:hypothetical protein